MLPSWFTKLRDVKTGSKQSKQQDKPHGSPPTTSARKRQDAPASLAKSFSLRRASSKARSAHFESEIIDACRSEDDVRDSISINQSDLCKNGRNVCDSPSSGPPKEVTGALLTHNCSIQLDASQVEADVKDMCLWDDDIQSNAKSKGNNGMSKLLPGEESKVSTQRGHVVSDTDTEEFALMSETSSTFGSETSSADSSVSSKCSTREEGHQGSQVGQQGVRSSECMHINLQKKCDGLFDAKVTKEQKESSGYPKLTSWLSQETAETRQGPILYELQRRRQHTLFSSSTGSTFPSDANKSSPNSSETRKTCISRESSSNLIERNANDSILRLEGDEECALLDNYSRGQRMADWKMPFVFGRRRKMKAKVNSTSDIRADKHRACTCDDFSLAIAKGPLQKDRETAHSSVGGLDITTGSTLRAHQMSMGENFPGKYTTVQLQRRRQRGSSISAVLPPDLQGVVGDSLAFVKISDDPYEDFRQSMYEMIMEKDLEGSMDVEELLYCYLTLNSPEQHELIEEVFSDVWSAVLMTMR